MIHWTLRHIHVAILWNFLLFPTGAWIEYIYLKSVRNIVNIPSIIQKGASISFFTLMAVVNNSPFSSSKVDSQTRNCWSLIFIRILEFLYSSSAISSGGKSSLLACFSFCFMGKFNGQLWSTSNWFLRNFHLNESQVSTSKLYFLVDVSNTTNENKNFHDDIGKGVFHGTPQMILFLNFNHCLLLKIHCYIGSEYE